MHVMSRPRSDGMGLKPQEPYEGLGGNIRLRMKVKREPAAYRGFCLLDANTSATDMPMAMKPKDTTPCTF